MYSRAEYRRRLHAFIAQERERREQLSGNEKRKCTIALRSAEAELARLDADDADDAENASNER